MALRSYNNLLSAVECNFSAEIGADAQSIRRFVDRLAENAVWKEGMRQELDDSLVDPAMSWRTALWGEQCHVFEADSEQQARAWVLANLSPLLSR